VEFRRPSVLRLYGHAWEWAGFLNYSKAVPAAQQMLSAQNKFTYYFTNHSGGRVVPQGSNEDGFNITPRGLEDVETGATLSVTDIGSATLDDIQQTDFPNGLTASEITVDRLVVNNTAILPPLGATTTVQGGVELASASELRSTATLSGTTDAQLDAAINADAVVVTKKGLEYWRTQNRLVSARPGTQYVYVDPVNGRTGLSTDALLSDPPTSGISGKPVRYLADAAAYANAAYSSNETVEFRIGAGMYMETGVITFQTQAIIRAWDFTAQDYLNDYTNGGTVPFSGANFYDHTKQPTFLTSPDNEHLYVGTGQTALLVQANPLRFVFEQAADVVGVTWWGIQQTLSDSDVPDSFFISGNTSYVAADRSTPTNWRALAIGDFSNACNYYLRAQSVDAAVIEGTAGQVYGLRSAPCVRFNSTGALRNVAIGAMEPSDFTIGGISRNSRRKAIIQLASDVVVIAGLCLMGNVRYDNSQNTGAYASVRFRGAGQSAGSYAVSTYELTGHCSNLFTGSTADTLRLTFGEPDGASGTVGTNTMNYNNTWSNVRLFSTAATPTIATSTASSSGSSAYWRTLGPAFGSIFDNFSVYSGTDERFWTQYWVSASGSSGFEGVFGNYNLLQVSTNLRTTGLAVTSGITINGIGYDTTTTIFRKASTGAIPAIDAGVTDPGDLGAFTNFNDLNIRVRTLRAGIDVTDSRIINTTVVL
jgi:hypothetical protein